MRKFCQFGTRYIFFIYNLKQNFSVKKEFFICFSIIIHFILTFLIKVEYGANMIFSFEG